MQPFNNNFMYMKNYKHNTTETDGLSNKNLNNEAIYLWSKTHSKLVLVSSEPLHRGWVTTHWQVNAGVDWAERYFSPSGQVLFSMVFQCGLETNMGYVNRALVINILKLQI